MPQTTRRMFLSFIAATALTACNAAPVVSHVPPQRPALPLHPNETPDLRRKINHWADFYDLPRPLVHRLAIRESTQILPATARSMGFQGSPSDLLDADTNLKYALKYLRGAWLLSDGDHGTAIKWYARGYYYEAKKRGMLVETGLRDG